MPTRNRADALAERLEELRGQTFADFELVVVDDGSSDHTNEVVRTAAERDPRIRYVSLSPSLGMPQVLQRCVEECSSDLVSIFHDHDRYEPAVLEMLWSALDAQPEASFAHTGIRLLSPADGREIGRHIHQPRFGARNEILESFVRTGACPVCASATMVRRSMLPPTPFATSLGLFADVRLWCELSALGSSAYVPEPLVAVQGWTEEESLAKFNWRTINELTALRLEYANRLYPQRLMRQVIRIRVRMSSTRSRIEFVARLIRLGRSASAPSAATAGMPGPLKAIFDSARGGCSPS